MSELRADTITASDGTSPVTLTKQSAAKHWANITSGGTVEDSFNQSSITDNDFSDCTYNFTNSMSNGLYANSGMATFDITANPYRTLGFFGTDPSTSAFRTHGFFSTTMATNDMTTSTVMTNGDLA